MSKNKATLNKALENIISPTNNISNNNSSTKVIDLSNSSSKEHLKPKTTITITNTSNPLLETFINISFSNAITYSKYIQSLIIYLMRYFNMLLGAKTNINYNILPIKNFLIEIPIYLYRDEEAKLTPLELITKRVNTVKNYFETFDWKIMNNQVLWVIRTLNIEKINIFKAFSLSVVCNAENCDSIYLQDISKFNTPLKLNTYEIPNPKVLRFELIDKSTITILEDSFALDYGLFVNLSCPFDEMAMSYNALHLYEHLCTKAWSNLDSANLNEMNGSTYPSGISFIYSTHITKASLMNYLQKTIKWVFSSRDENFWQNHSEDIKLETERTISETRNERSLSMFGRSDYKAYKSGYDIKIFEFWSNKPFNILLVVPKKLEIDIAKLNDLCKKHPLRKITKPKNISFKNIPADILISKTIEECFNLKVNTSEIVNAFMKNKFDEHAYFGVDVKCFRMKEKLFELNSVLYPLLFINNGFKDAELKEFVNNHMFPRYSSMLKTTNCMNKYNDFIEFADEDLGDDA